MTAVSAGTSESSATTEPTSAAADSIPVADPQATAADAFRRLSNVQPAVRAAAKRERQDVKIGAPEEGQGEKPGGTPQPAPEPAPRPPAAEPPAK